jgi:hypothetical protein
VKIEGASQDELAASERSLSTREVAHVGGRDGSPAVGEQYAGSRVGGGAR